jgi:hypothetical protein
VSRSACFLAANCQYPKRNTCKYTWGRTDSLFIYPRSLASNNSLVLLLARLDITLSFSCSEGSRIPRPIKLWRLFSSLDYTFELAFLLLCSSDVAASRSAKAFQNFFFFFLSEIDIITALLPTRSAAGGSRRALLGIQKAHESICCGGSCEDLVVLYGLLRCLQLT